MAIPRASREPRLAARPRSCSRSCRSRPAPPTTFKAAARAGADRLHEQRRDHGRGLRDCAPRRHDAQAQWLVQRPARTGDDRAAARRRRDRCAWSGDRRLHGSAGGRAARSRPSSSSRRSKPKRCGEAGSTSRFTVAARPTATCGVGCCPDSRPPRAAVERTCELWRGKSSWLAAGAAALAAAAHAQTGAYTEQQAAAGRSSYLANCVSCHQADLRGANEARPLVGADFMKTWGTRSAQDLVAFLGVAMPPPPAAPGSLGAQSYVNLAAFLLQANGAQAGRRAADRELRHGDRQRRERRDAEGLPRGARDRGARRRGRRRAPGSRVAGRVARFTPVTDAQLRNPPPSDWLMIRGGYRAWSYSELDQVNARQRRRAVAPVDLVDDRRRLERARADRARRRAVPLQHGQRDPGARRGDRRADLGESRRPAVAGQRGDARPRDLRRQGVHGHERRAARRARRAHRPEGLGDDHRRPHRRRLRRVERPDRDPRQGRAGHGQLHALPQGKCFISAYDAKDGRELWRFNTVATDAASPAATRGTASPMSTAPAATPGSRAATTPTSISRTGAWRRPSRGPP